MKNNNNSKRHREHNFQLLSSTFYFHFYFLVRVIRNLQHERPTPFFRSRFFFSHFLFLDSTVTHIHTDIPPRLHNFIFISTLYYSDYPAWTDTLFLPPPSYVNFISSPNRKILFYIVLLCLTWYFHFILLNLLYETFLLPLQTSLFSHIFLDPI